MRSLVDKDDLRLLATWAGLILLMLATLTAVGLAVRLFLWAAFA